MFKFLFILLISFNFCFSDTIFQGKCVESFYTSGNSIYINFSNGAMATVLYEDSILNQLASNLDLFVFNKDSNNCELFSSNNSLKLPYRDYNFLLALFGLLLGNSIMSLFLRS